MADALGGYTPPSAPPVVSATGSVRQPLGPPTDFYKEQALFKGPEADPEFLAKGPYVQGDQGTPGFSMNTEDRDRLKARMNAAGLYGTSGYQSGSWTPADADAYAIVLETANMMGMRNPDVVIDNIASEVTKNPRVQGPRAPLVSRISNPDDIRAVIRDSAFSLTGSRLSDEDEQRLIGMYQGQQGAADQAAYAAGGAAGGTVTDPAGMANFAEAQIERMRPGEVATHRHLEAFEKILGSMGTMAEETPTYKGAGLPTEQTEVL